MILIFGSTGYEQGIDPVLEWLSYYGANFKKLTHSDFFDSESAAWEFNMPADQIVYRGTDLTKEVNVIWNRRLEYYTDGQAQLVDQLPSAIAKQLETELTRENRQLIAYTFDVLGGKTWLPKAGLAGTNKLSVLRMAKRCGLCVPQTILTDSKDILARFIKDNGGRVITKPISDSFYYSLSDTATYLAYTTIIKEDYLVDFDDRFQPSLFQECIAAEMELRVFYLDNTIFCQAAIPCGAVADDIVDIKQKRDAARINHVVFELPTAVKQQIHTLMNALDLRMGSLDLLYTGAGQYVFLEVNPGGQYLFESQNCQFNIERRIAEWLIKHDKK